jgi:hypothetical protein
MGSVSAKALSDARPVKLSPSASVAPSPCVAQSPSSSPTSFALARGGALMANGGVALTATLQ